ncbi:MAG: type VI secretion system Vgr family protein, partial [Chthoniobacteraceae bacterium]
DIAEADGFADEGSPYLCEFDATPLSEPYRAPRVSQRPFVQGPQTAVVVGPSGEEIYTDKHGRVKVQFHWDREGTKNEGSTCWVRVSQPWAGKGWGSVSIPRIGQEVVVDFLEGDPDSPIIVGRVYNGECTPPFDLPGKKMVSGVKSNSTPGGGGYNEISLDDTKGTEKIVIHGQYDMETEILHDDTKTVGNNESTTIAVDRDVTVGKNHDETVGMNQTKTIGKSRSLTVGVDETINISAKQSTTIGGLRELTVGGSDTTKVGGVRSATVGGAESLSVGAAMTVSAGAAISMTAGGVITITAAGAITITAGAALAITAPAIVLNGRPVLPIPAPI